MFANALHTFGKRNICQTAALAERIISNACYTVRNHNAFQLFATAEGPLANIFYIFRNHDIRQATIAKRVFPNTCHSVRNHNILQCTAARKCTSCDTCHTRWKRNVLYCIAVFKCTIPNACCTFPNACCTFRKGDIYQSYATPECTPSNMCYAVWNCNTPQPFTDRKRVISNGFHTFRNCNTCQIFAVPKRIFSDTCNTFLDYNSIDRIHIFVPGCFIVKTIVFHCTGSADSQSPSAIVKLPSRIFSARTRKAIFFPDLLHRSRYRLPDVGLGKRRQRQHLAQHRQCQHCCQQPHKFFHTRSSFFVSERSYQPLCYILRPHAAFPQPLLRQISSHRKNSFTLTEFTVFFVHIHHSSPAIFVFVPLCPLSLWKNGANPSVSAFFVHNFVVLYFQMVIFS